MALPIPIAGFQSTDWPMPDSNPKISIITVAFNADATIADTFDSVRHQTWTNREFIVIDGASTDTTVNIIRENEDIIDYWVSERDYGLYDAMNKGLRLATGDYVGFLNADDFFACRDSLEAMARGSDDCDWVLGNTAIVDAEDKRLVKRFYEGHNFKFWQFRFGHMPPHPSTYVKRSLFDESTNFSTEFSIGADFELLLRQSLTRPLSVARVNRTIVALRVGGISTRGLQSARVINQQIARACDRAGLATHSALIWAKYAWKWTQLFRKPLDYPA